MASIKATLLDNLQHKLKLHPTRNVIISGFGLASLLFLTLLILVNNRLSASSSFFINVSTSSIVSWSISLPNTALSSFGDKNNATNLGNFTDKLEIGVVGNQTQFGNLDLEVKNVSCHLSNAPLSSSGDRTNNATHSESFTRKIGNRVKRDKSHIANLGFEVKNVSLFGREVGIINDSVNSSLANSSGHLEFGTRLDKETDDGGSIARDCDIFDGRWERDDNLPHYPPGSCPLIDPDFNCHLNGRPDSGFYRWKWQPNGCNFPRLNATEFLERLRGKKLVFVGDSLNRNMWESLVCILRHSIKDKRRVYEISGKREFKKQGFYAFRFEDYNCSVDYVRAPFLVRESTFQGKNGSFPTLRLDLMEKTTKMYLDAHVLVFNTGHWWTHEKTSKGEDYYQEGNYVHPRLEALQAYKRALTTWGRWIDRHVDRNKTLVFFRGYSSIHFRGGQWNSGGQCHKETEPIFNKTYLEKYPSKMRALEHILGKMQTPVMYLNISRLTDYRKDAHPSIYRKSYKTTKELIEAEQSQDCSHWCLPGVPDTWNELLYVSLMKLGWGSST